MSALSYCRLCKMLFIKKEERIQFFSDWTIHYIHSLELSVIRVEPDICSIWGVVSLFHFKETHKIGMAVGLATDITKYATRFP